MPRYQTFLSSAKSWVFVLTTLFTFGIMATGLFLGKLDWDSTLTVITGIFGVVVGSAYEQMRKESSVSNNS
jgi:type IV secretory pathway VirB2 component (pilin)